MSESSSVHSNGIAPALMSALAIAAGAVLLLVPALYNGFPFLIADTGTYLGVGVEALEKRWLSAPWSRSVFYSLFVLPLHLKLSLWPIVVAQALLLAHLIYLVMRAMIGRAHPALYLLIMLVLTALTSLPWFVGAISPDVFAAVVVLGMFLLGFGIDRLSRVEVAYVVLLTAAAISFHFAHVPLALGLLVVIPFLRALPGRLPFRLGALALLAAPLALAVASLVAVQVATRSETSAAPHGHLFLLARFIADGPARSYLEANCPHGKFALCEYLDRLGSSSDDFLWNRDSPLYQIGVNNLRDEAKTIVRGSLLAYPAWHARLAFESTVAQLTRFNTGSSLISFANKGEAVNKVIKDHFPGAYEAFVNSRQYTKRWSIEAVRAVHYYIIVLSAIAALPLTWLMLRRQQRRLVALLAVIVTGLVGNAFICAALSNITDRYQSRIIWLLVLFALLAAVPLLAERRRQNPGNNP